MFDKIRKFFTTGRTGKESYFVKIDGEYHEISRLDYLDHYAQEK